MLTSEAQEFLPLPGHKMSYSYTIKEIFKFNGSRAWFSLSLVFYPNLNPILMFKAKQLKFSHEINIVMSQDGVKLS